MGKGACIQYMSNSKLRENGVGGKLMLDATVGWL